MTKPTAELIACPFCGTKPHPVVTYDTCADKDTFCDNDDCPIQGVVMSVDRWQNQPKADRLAEQEAALKLIANEFLTLEEMPEEAEKVGLDYHEYLEMAYENIKLKAKQALQPTTEDVK